jgi:hypothetical protein
MDAPLISSSGYQIRDLSDFQMEGVCALGLVISKMAATTSVDDENI